MKTARDAAPNFDLWLAKLPFGDLWTRCAATGGRMPTQAGWKAWARASKG